MLSSLFFIYNVYIVVKSGIVESRFHTPIRYYTINIRYHMEGSDVYGSDVREMIRARGGVEIAII